MFRLAFPTLAGVMTLSLSASVLAAPATSGAVTLDNVNINAEQGSSDAATTEGTRSYTTGSMSTATKLPLSIRETPQSVSVMSAKFSRNATISYLQGVESIHDQHKPTAASLFRGVPAG